MFKDIEIKLSTIEEHVASAAQKDKDAREAYFECVERRKSGVTQKIKELQDELKKVKELLKIKVQDLSEAWGDGNVDEAVAIEGEIEAANNAIAELDYKISLLSNTEPKGEEELYLAAVSAFKNKFSVVQEEASKLPELRTQLKEIRLVLEQNEKALERAEWLIRKSNDNGSSSEKQDLIGMVEAFEGKIDVTGHNALQDDEAKVRYIRGSLSGIENTPAGQKLKEKLDGGM